MPVWRLILAELRHRWVNFTLAVLAVWATVAFFVAFLTMAEASQRETVRVTRDIGFNLRIIPKAADLDRFWEVGFSEATMPEETLHRLAASSDTFMTYNHLVATLQKRFVLEGKPVILTGLAPEVVPPGFKKKPMGFQIKPGTVQVGHQVAARLGLMAGATLTLGEQKFEVAKCLVESGTDDDIRVFGTLKDIQKVLGEENRINEIKAIDCLCMTADQDPLRVLRQELAKTLPEAQVIQLRAIADARARQRQTAQKYFAFITPLLLVLSAGWVGVLAILNVRERRTEIGVLRALGHGSTRIAALFLGKAVVIGLLGAGLGFAAGSWLAVQYGPRIFQVTAAAIHPQTHLLWLALWAAPLFAAVCSFIPAMWAVTQDPAVNLREE